MKDYSWTITVQHKDGSLEYVNETDETKRLRRAWYKTEKSARSNLKVWLSIYDQPDNKILSWMLFHRNHGIGVIDSYTAE